LNKNAQAQAPLSEEVEMNLRPYVLGIPSTNEAELPLKDLAVFLTVCERRI
jgi:hypothetical protein